MSWSLEELQQPSDLLPGNTAVTRLMHAAWAGSPLLRAFFRIESARNWESRRDREHFALWYRLAAPASVRMNAEWTAALHNPRQASQRGLHAVLAFTTESFFSTGCRLPVSLRRWVLNVILSTLKSPGADDVAPSDLPPASSTTPDRSFGLSLIGYSRSELGLGEYLRNAATALQVTELPFAVLDCSHIPPQRKEDRRFVSMIRDDSPYFVNFFPVTADQMHSVCVSFPPRATLGHYNIGGWMWELSRFPDALRPMLGLIDEVWAPSQFVRDSLSGCVPTEKLRHMPACVTVSLAKGRTRGEFGLPEDRFLFVFSFDACSNLHRKNPIAVIRAFRRAFPAGNEAVGLVLKVMNAQTNDPAWRNVLAELNDEPRIQIISRTMDRDEWLGLMSVCDAYVSLHRSEGFGYGPAEAMLLGKPVVLTGYGGVTDFARPETALPVSYRLISVERDQFPFHEGQVWADPDIEEAAQHMRKLASTPELAQRVGAAGAEFVRKRHAPAVVGRHYRARLEEIVDTFRCAQPASCAAQL